MSVSGYLLLIIGQLRADHWLSELMIKAPGKRNLTCQRPIYACILCHCDDAGVNLAEWRALQDIENGHDRSFWPDSIGTTGFCRATRAIPLGLTAEMRVVTLGSNDRATTIVSSLVHAIVACFAKYDAIINRIRSAEFYVLNVMCSSALAVLVLQPSFGTERGYPSSTTRAPILLASQR